MSGAAAVRALGLVKRFAEGGAWRTVLDGADLTVRAGETVALLGRSGSGKSTLLNLLGGLEAPDAGEVWIGDAPLHASSERERTLVRRRRIGFVFQHFDLLPTLTVRENVLLPLALDGREDAAARARAGELLDAVGLADRAATFPDRLSGGEQQRVAIARALSHDPTVVLADEPTGNLDAATADTVLDLFARLLAERGRTLVLATHSYEAAARADRVLVVADGRVEERAGAAR